MKLYKVYNKTLRKVFAVFILFFCIPFSAFAEEVSSLISNINLKADGSFTVAEEITYDFGNADRHGIYRYIPKTHPQQSSSLLKERFVAIELQGVTLNGQEVPYEVTDSNEKFEIKIGDPYTTLSGTQNYSVFYTVKGGYSYLEDGTTELYWNVTGNGWEVPILQATAHLSSDSDLMLNDRTCYEGPEGQSSVCTQVQAEEYGGVRFLSSALDPLSGLTVAQAIDGAKVQKVVLERFNFVLLFVILVPFLALGIGIFGYRYRTSYKTGNPIIAQYEPYKEFKPMYAGMLFDGRLDPQDITAGIVYLAERGFLKIKKIEKKVLFMFEVDDYEMELMRLSSEVESDFLKSVLGLLYPVNALVGEKLTLSSLKSNTQQQTQNQILLQKLRKDLKKDLIQSGFFQTNKTASILLYVCGGFLFLMFFAGEIIYMSLGLETLLLFGVALLTGLCLSVFMFERRTKIGYEALDYLKGFKLFLSVTDAERFKFHNAPQKEPEQFMEYLPYAIAFGVEKQWAKVFEGITIPNPSWYDNGSVNSFSAVNLTSSLGAFSTSFAASSGGSASSGGGSSGGGGGGGGGGSW